MHVTRVFQNLEPTAVLLKQTSRHCLSLPSASISWSALVKLALKVKRGSSSTYGKLIGHKVKGVYWLYLLFLMGFGEVIRCTYK